MNSGNSDRRSAGRAMQLRNNDIIKDARYPETSESLCGNVGALNAPCATGSFT